MVTGKPHKPTRFARFVLYPLVGTLFLIALTVVLTMAKGYKINYKDGKINLTKTGMLIVSTRPFDAQIYLNGKATKYKTGFYLLATRISGLIPGDYDIEIKKDGYRSWHDNLEIKPNLVTWANYVLLFAEKLNIDKIDVPNGEMLAKSKNGRHVLFTSTVGGFGLKSLDTNSLTIKDFWPEKTDKPWLVSPKIIMAEFSPSSDRVLLKISNDSRTEYVVADSSTTPVKLIHLNNTLGQDFTRAWWNTTDNNELYLETKTGIYLTKLTATQISSPVLSGAIAFKVDEGRQIFYIVKDEANIHSVSKMSLNGDNKTKLIDNVLPSSSYELGYSQKSEVLTVLNHDTGDLTAYYIGKASKNHSVNLSKNVTSFSWSDDGQFLFYYGNDFIKRYDWEKELEAEVVLSDIPSKVQWYFDEAHYLITNKKGIYVMDYDGSNVVPISEEATDVCVLDQGNANIIFSAKNSEKSSTYYRFIPGF